MSANADLAEALTEHRAELWEAATINGSAATAQVTAISSDTVLLAGGTGEKDGFSLTVSKADFPNVPAQFVAVIARGVTLKKLTHEERRAHWVLICGDPASEP